MLICFIFPSIELLNSYCSGYTTSLNFWYCHQFTYEIVPISPTPSRTLDAAFFPPVSVHQFNTGKLHWIILMYISLDDKAEDLYTCYSYTSLFLISFFFGYSFSQINELRALSCELWAWTLFQVLNSGDDVFLRDRKASLAQVSPQRKPCSVWAYHRFWILT